MTKKNATFYLFNLNSTEPCSHMTNRMYFAVHQLKEFKLELCYWWRDLLLSSQDHANSCNPRLSPVSKVCFQHFAALSKTPEEFERAKVRTAYKKHFEWLHTGTDLWNRWDKLQSAVSKIIITISKTLQQWSFLQGIWDKIKDQAVMTWSRNLQENSDLKSIT